MLLTDDPGELGGEHLLHHHQPRRRRERQQTLAHRGGDIGRRHRRLQRQTRQLAGRIRGRDLHDRHHFLHGDPSLVGCLGGLPNPASTARPGEGSPPRANKPRDNLIWLSRLEFRRRAIWYDPADGSVADVSRTVVGIDWDAAAEVLASAPAAASERRVLALAIGPADGDAHPVDLGDALCGLDRRNAAHVLRALAHAAGLHERNVQIVDNGAVRQVTST